MAATDETLYTCMDVLKSTALLSFIMIKKRQKDKKQQDGSLK